MDTSLEHPRLDKGPGAKRSSRRTAKLASTAFVLLLVAGVVGYLAQNGLPDEAGSPAASKAVTALPSPAHAVSGRSQAAEPGLTLANPALDQGATSTKNDPSHGAAGGIPGANEVPGVGPKIVRTASIGIVVARGEFTKDFQQASTIATALGGFVSSSNAMTRSGALTLRVPASKFDRARARLTELGVQTVHEQIHGQDVTAQFVDLKARLRILQAREAALVALLRKATSLSTILRLQNAVDDVRTQIEQLRGQVNLINDRTAFATITLSMREQGQSAAPSADRPSLTHAWTAAVAGFLRVISFVVIGLGYVVPLAAIGAGAGWVVVRLRRRGLTVEVPSDG
jgi:Domain of unknown function (DUF4349)